jgi:hypothetical protein
MTITKKLAVDYAERWVDLWNESSIDGFLNLCTEDTVHASKFINFLQPNNMGFIKGKNNIKHYLMAFRECSPRYEMNLVEVHPFENKLVLFLKNIHERKPMITILTLNEDLLIERTEVSCHDIPSWN